MPMSAPLNVPPFSLMETLPPSPAIRKRCLLSAVGARSAACTPSANHCGAGPSYELTSAAVLLLCATPGVTPKPTATMPITLFPGTACSTFLRLNVPPIHHVFNPSVCAKSIKSALA